ncbi:MAG: OmpA family protein [Candidatus Korobacteraceae bacterium]|jgi:outer membrane protein OmpA-like peptidoglycan-associated protein
MKRILLPMLAAGVLALAAGCASKTYVKQQTAPIVNKVDELDVQTGQTTRGIHDLDQRSQQGIQGVDAKAVTADQKAQAARQRADEAQQLAANANNGVNDLTNQVINLDNYHAVTEAAVHFGFDKADLSAKDKRQLDQIGAEIPNVRGYIVQIEGRTDSVGNPDYNYGLSQRRAAAVTQYLASMYNVPAHKIFVIGLGKDAPVEANKTARGRAENRRVDVRLMSNSLEAQNAERDPAAESEPAQTPAATANPQR